MKPGLSIGIGTMALAILCLPLSAESGHRGRNVSTNTERGPIDRCDQIRVTFDDVEAARSEEEILVARSRDPLSISESTGTVRAHAKNGPISLKACSGNVEAQAVNGPISVSRSGGDLRLETQNGPISVELAGRRWEGAGLVARAVNGPLSLKIP